MPRFRPQLFDIRHYLTRDQIPKDLVAGVTVGIVALPLAIAFGIASGVTPAQGLGTAIIAGALIAAFGGSRVQIGGPTGAFVVLVALTIERFGFDGLLVATLLAGAMLVIAGLLGAGALIRYIPLPVTTGFTSGIALIIAVGQLADALGLELTKVPAAFLPKLQVLAGAIGGVQPAAVGVTAATVAILLVWPRTGLKIPGPFVALILTTVGVALLDLPVATIGSRFGELPSGLPRPSLPSVSLERLPDLFAPAATIALLGAIESLLAAVVADSMTGFRHRANTELVGQGIANLAVPFFGGIPATGAIARTATNIRSGGRTPIAGLVHAATLLVLVLVAGPLALHIPMATLAGILVIVAWHMGEWHSFLRLARGSRHDAAVLLTTFGFTVLADLTVGIGMGMAVAAFLFVQRMSNATHVITGDDDDDSEAVIRRAWLPKGVRLLEVRGPLFFGGAETLRRALDVLPDPSQLLAVDLAAAPGLDVTTARILRDFAEQSRTRGTRVIFITRDATTATALRREGLERALSVERAVRRWQQGSGA
ncbi:MAG: SulP family inorganic anion transporter [Gemmatimonadales bacterium]|nr:SulP family inorganic anion transporter [Gemmatimonadales bacterium]